MASENLELVRSLYARWSRGDFTWLDWTDPEIEFVIADGPAAGTWTGLAGMTEAFRELTSAWTGHRTEPEEYRELDGERVFVLIRVHGRAKISGMDLAEMNARAASLFHVRNGKVTKIVAYGDREQALADLGLKE